MDNPPALGQPVIGHLLKRKRDAKQPALLAHVVEKGAVFVFHVEHAMHLRLPETAIQC